MIRTFRKNHHLSSRSRNLPDPESEMEEVYNKLRALNKALDLAETI
jgi:anthranilate synthase component 1